MVPGSTQKIGITLVLSAGIITSTTVTNLATEPTSSNYQNDFNTNYKSYVVGKKLADIVLTKVSRSSLTTVGFNNAANAIKLQAS